MNIWAAIVTVLLVICFALLVRFKIEIKCTYCGKTCDFDYWWLSRGRCHWGCFKDANPFPFDIDHEEW